MRQQDVTWPSADYNAEQLRYEIAQSKRLAKRDAEKRQREARRWWGKTIAVAAVLLAAAVALLWAVSGQAFPGFFIH